MESYIYDNNKVSIKDLEGDINLSHRKWDYIFDFILKRTNVAYFSATRLEYMDAALKNNINLLVDQNIQLSEEGYFRVAFKLRDSSILMGRGLVNDLWKHYEYPAILFLGEELSQNNFKRLFQAKYYDDIFSFSEKMYIIYKNIELDVLWLEKTMDMDFPQLP